MKSKEFEDVVLYRLREEEKRGNATCSRYGVQASFMRGQPISEAEQANWVARIDSTTFNAEIVGIVGEIITRCKTAENTFRPLQSLPDFEGCVPSGRQFIFDAKVCSAASMDLHTSHVAERQLEHLRKRSRFGAITFLLIHFTERTLTKRTDPAQTFAFPVDDGHFWLAFDRGETKRITRADCEEYAEVVTWNCLSGGRTERPDVLSAIHRLADRLSPRPSVGLGRPAPATLTPGE